MSETIVDMPKVTQMLDAGWTVTIAKGGMGSYFCTADHDNGDMMNKRRHQIADSVSPDLYDIAFETAFETDDFTPEQALTRMAYKVMGEII